MQNKSRKFRNEKNPATITVLVLAAILISNLILTGDWLALLTPAKAEITGGAEIDLTGSTTTTEWAPRTAVAADGRQIYVWYMNTGGDLGVFYKLYDNEGNVLISRTQIADDISTHTQLNADVAMDMNGNFIVAWADRVSGEWDIHMKAFKADGTQVGNEEVVSNKVADERFPRVSLQYETETTNRAVVVWRESPYSSPDLYQRVYEINFESGSESFASYTSAAIVNTYTTGSQTEQDVAMRANGDYIITWTGSGPTTGNGWYRVYNRSGTAQTPTDTQELSFHTSATTPTATSIADGSQNRFVVAYTSGTNIYARFINCQSGISLCILGVSEIEIASGVGYSQPSVGMDYFGNFVVAYRDTTAQDGDGYGIFAQYVNKNGELVGSQFQVNTTTANNQISPHVDMSHDGTYAISFEDQTDGTYMNEMKAQYYVSDLFKNGTESISLASADANTQNDIDVDVAPNGNIVMVWEENGDIMMTLKDSTGAVINGKQNVDIDNGGTNSNPAVAFFKDSDEDVGRFIVTWESILITTKDIEWRSFEADGDVHSTGTADSSTGNQILPDIDTGYYDPGFHFSIAWIDTNTETVRLRTSTDWFNTKDVSTNCTAATACEYGVGVAMDPTNNNAIVAWAEDNSTDTDIYVRPYISGTAGSPLSVSAIATIDEHSPDIKFIKLGSPSEYVVALVEDHTYSKISYYHGIFNSYVIGGYWVGNIDWLHLHDQITPRIATDAEEGDIFIVWGDLPATASNDNIWGMFSDYTPGSPGSLSPYGLPIRINSTTTSNQLNPSVGVNTEGDIIVGWEGAWEDDVNEGVDDSAAPVYQLGQESLMYQTIFISRRSSTKEQHVMS
jgi:hypothetical protein